MKRVFLIVLDSFGIGEMPDAADYGDKGTNTLASVAKSPYFSMKNMKQMGLFNIDGVTCGEKVSSTTAIKITAAKSATNCACSTVTVKNGSKKVEITVIVSKTTKAKVYLVACERERNGRKAPSWFNLNTLTKRDIDNKPVQGEFYEAGNMKARLELLAEKGAITCVEKRTIQVPIFGDDGKPEKIEAIDDEGNVTLVNKPGNQDVAIISDYAE